MNPGSHAPPECLTLAFDGSVATLTLHHGPMNAIDDALLDELVSALDAVAANSAISVLRIRSERRVFSAGADLRLVAERLAKASGADEMKATVRRFHDVYDLLAGLTYPTKLCRSLHCAASGWIFQIVSVTRINIQEPKWQCR